MHVYLRDTLAKLGGPIRIQDLIHSKLDLWETERNYSTTEKELLAIVWGMRYFRPYLYGRKFVVVTEHKPLTWIMSVKDPGSRLLRWRIKLEEYDYEIVCKRGALNTNADALSRVSSLIKD